MGNLDTKAQVTSFDDATVVIDRETDTANAVLKTYTTVYNGSANFQSGYGSQYRNPGGVIDIADAWMRIRPAADKSLPDVQVGDRATVTQYVNGVARTAVVYNVDNVSLWASSLPHLEIVLKRGPGAWKAR